jgi:hypothetical protein
MCDRPPMSAIGSITETSSRGPILSLSLFLLFLTRHGLNEDTAIRDRVFALCHRFVLEKLRET